MNNKPTHIVMLGFDADKKPRAARFSSTDEAAALKAAAAMGLRLAYAKSDAAIALARKLPEGKLFASGKGTVPLVKASLYDQLVAELEFKPVSSAPTNGAIEIDPALMSAAATLWSSIKPGSIVLVFFKETANYETGWYDSVVLAVGTDNETLTVRWRDYPGFKPFTVKRQSVGLAMPGRK